MKLVKGRYSIEYNNGITQEKNLVSHTDFTSIIKPLSWSLDHFKSTKNKEAEEIIKKELKSLIGEDDFFTDDSEIFKASKTGILALKETMGGPRPCIVKRIK